MQSPCLLLEGLRHLKDPIAPIHWLDPCSYFDIPRCEPVNMFMIQFSTSNVHDCNSWYQDLSSGWKNVWNHPVNCAKISIVTEPSNEVCVKEMTISSTMRSVPIVREIGINRIISLFIQQGQKLIRWPFFLVSYDQNNWVDL